MEYSIIHQATQETPVTISTRICHTSFGHRSAETELLFFLSGEADLIVSEKTFHMKAEDVCLINRNDSYFLSGNGCELLSVAFSLHAFAGFRSRNLCFSFNSCGNTSQIKYNYVRHLIAQLVRVNASGESHFETMSLLYALVGHLISNYQIPLPERVSASDNMLSILEYIDEHYAENLSLSSIADRFHLTVPYLSSSFSRNLHTTFLKYYNSVRLSHAVHCMLTQDASLESIALSNGFSDIRSFTSVFKKTYHCLPSVYRKKIHQNSAFTGGSSQKQNSDEFTNTLKSLAKYLTESQDKEKHLPLNSFEMVRLDAGTLSYLQSGIPLTHNFKKICCIASARHFLFADVQQMILQAQKDIGYEYVQFHGILSDEMMMYQEDSEGNPVYSFVFADKVLDFILRAGLKPILELSFMPQMLSSEPDRCQYISAYNTAPPKSMRKWVSFIHTFVSHLQQRYGLARLRTWMFTVWNEPDSSHELFGWDNPALFFEFYRQTRSVVKALDSELIFGAPSFTVRPQNENSMAKTFIQYCAEHSCLPDFINIHYYDNNFFSDNSSISASISAFSPLKEDPFAFTVFINDFKASMRKNYLKNIPVYLTEWNLTISQRDFINDTCFKSCYLVKNLLENYDRLDAFGYWCMTDFHEELQPSNDLYHGGLGLFTYNGIPKAHYNAFSLLNRLGNELLARGNGYFITKKDQDLVLILYNYEHFSKLFAKGMHFDADKNNRYAPFTNSQKAQFHLEVSHLPSSTCLIKELYINQNKGSSYDTWLSMNQPELFEPDELTFLIDQSTPGCLIHRENIVNGTLIYNTTLEPLEVKYVQIKL